MNFQKLFEPKTASNLEIHNRVVFPPLSSGVGRIGRAVLDGFRTDLTVYWHENPNKEEGEHGLSRVESS